MKKNLFVLNFLLIIIILFLPVSVVTQDNQLSNLEIIKDLFSSKKIGEVAQFHHDLISIPKSRVLDLDCDEKLKIALSEINQLINLKPKKLDPILFSKKFGEKLNYSMIRSVTRGSAVISIYLAEKKKYKKSLKLIKHLFAFSLAMAKDSINYEEDETGSLLEYMISIAIFNIIIETSEKIIANNSIPRKELSKIKKFIINVEKVIPDMLLTFKSEYGQTKKMIKELKKHEIGFFTYIERESFGDDSKVAPMEVYIIDAIRESEDASYVYDLFLEDSLSELKEFYTKLWSLNGIPYDKMKNILSSIDYDLINGKSCRNFLSMVAIPNFMRAKEQEMKMRKKLKKLIEICDAKIKGK